MTKTKIPTLETQPREKIGTRYAKRDREAGRTPAVIYGHKLGAVHLTVDSRELSDLLHSESHVINIKVGGTDEFALIKAMQWDTFGKEVIHVDFERVNMSEEVELDVELTLVGEPAAMKQAGVALDQPTTAVKIRCRADAIPSHLEHNIADLEIDVVVSVADLVMPEGVEAVTPRRAGDL